MKEEDQGQKAEARRIDVKVAYKARQRLPPTRRTSVAGLRGEKGCLRREGEVGARKRGVAVPDDGRQGKEARLEVTEELEVLLPAHRESSERDRGRRTAAAPLDPETQEAPAQHR